MMTTVYTREALASLFRSAADLLITGGSLPEGRGNGQTTGKPALNQPRLDYGQALDEYLKAHSHELGTLAGWCRKKYEVEPTETKAKSLLQYAQRQVAQGKNTPGPEPVF